MAWQANGAGYGPVPAMDFKSGIANRKVTTYDDLYEPTSQSKSSDRNNPKRTVSTKRKSPEATSEGKQDASAKRQKLGGGQLEDGSNGSFNETQLDGVHEGVTSAHAGDLWQRRGERLPVEFWQHVLTNLSPRHLGNLLAVNRLFYALLHPSPPESAQAALESSRKSAEPSALPFLRPDTIWQLSRRTFAQSMPSPLKGKSELEMWRIVCARSCQLCGSSGATTANDHAIGEVDPWHRGPGAKGVSPVFPFGIVTCGPCLVAKSVKELDLILSSVPSALHPALPAAFLTSDMHVISPSALQRSTDLSTHEKPSRIYWPDHIDRVKVEFESVRSLGSAAAEEWLKGLDARGKKALVDASRWEKWELAGGRARLWEPVPHKSGLSTSEVTTGAISYSPRNTTGLPVKTEQPSQAGTISSIAGTELASKPVANMIPGLNSTALADNAGKNISTSQPENNTAVSVDLLTASRRAEITRRASLLSPPIPPNILAQMDSFKDAVQKPYPLDDQAWETLKPALLAQREDAEKSASAAEVNVSAAQPSASAVLGEVPDKVWDEAQGHLRAELLRYADEFIAKQWEEGDRVTKKTSARFAVEALLHVRQSFYADVEKDAAAVRAAGEQPIVDPPQGPWTRKLTLENMKWIFDLRIRPLTEKHKKEPFFCNGCTQQKTFGLEGVIQHYAAKHNTDLSRGNVVVFWRAEWPAVPPFSPDPTRPGLAAPGKSSTKAQEKGKKKQAAQPKDDQPNYQIGGSPPYDRMPPTGPAATRSNPYTGGMPPTVNPRPERQGLLLSSGQDMVAQSPVHSGLAASTHTSNQDSQVGRARFVDSTAMGVWSIIGRMPGSASVRAAVLVHHVAKNFQDKYGEAVPLEMFICSVKRCQDPVYAAVIKKIQCKLCSKSAGYDFMGLLCHFKSAHLEKNKKGKQSPQHDWRTDMVLLPHINELKKMPKMLKDSHLALQLVTDAMPWAFDAPQGPASKQPQNKYTLPSRAAPAAMPSEIKSRQDGHAEQRVPNAPKTKAMPVSTSGAPPNAPKGPAAMTSKSKNGRVRGQPQASKPLPQQPPQQDVTSHAVTAHAATDEEMDDAYSPPPPEAYQTKSPVQAVAQPEHPSQFGTKDSSDLTNSAASSKQNSTTNRPSSYYHKENRPTLRPAREVYRNSKERTGENSQSTRDDRSRKVPGQPPTSLRADGYPQSRTQPAPEQFDASVRDAQAKGDLYGSEYQAAPYHDSLDPVVEHGRQGAQPTSARRRRSVSPRGSRAQPHYRERSPARHYYERPPPPPPAGGYFAAEPAEYRQGVEYEVVRVRDPAGDYLIRRPIRQDVYGYDPRGPRPPPVAIEYGQPQYLDPYGPAAYPSYPPPRAATVAPYPVQHATTMAPPQAYGPPVVYEEYDPLHPARLPPPPPPQQQQQQQRPRYGTEARY